MQAKRQVDFDVEFGIFLPRSHGMRRKRVSVLLAPECPLRPHLHSTGSGGLLQIFLAKIDEGPCRAVIAVYLSISLLGCILFNEEL